MPSTAGLRDGLAGRAMSWGRRRPRLGIIYVYTYLYWSTHNKRLGGKKLEAGGLGWQAGRADPLARRAALVARAGGAVSLKDRAGLAWAGPSGGRAGLPARQPCAAAPAQPARPDRQPNSLRQPHCASPALDSTPSPAHQPDPPGQRPARTGGLACRPGWRVGGLPRQAAGLWAGVGGGLRGARYMQIYFA